MSEVPGAGVQRERQVGGELAPLGAILAAVTDRFDQYATEVLVERCVGEHADYRLLPHASDGGGENTTPSSSEMAGDGATEGDGLDSGWD